LHIITGVFPDEEDCDAIGLGHGRSRKIPRSWTLGINYRDSNGAVLVYDISDEDSFQKVKFWVKELRKMLGSDITPCIAGNNGALEIKPDTSDTEARVNH